MLKMGSAVGNCCNGLFWLILLVFVSWWIATLAFPFYMVTSILTGCIPSLAGFSKFFLHGVEFPGKCSKNMVHMNSYDSF